MSFYYDTKFCVLNNIDRTIKHDFDFIVNMLLGRATNNDDKYYFNKPITKHINDTLKTNKTRFRECHIRSYIYANIHKCEQFVHLPPYIPKTVTSIEITV